MPIVVDGLGETTGSFEHRAQEQEGGSPRFVGDGGDQVFFGFGKPLLGQPEIGEVVMGLGVLGMTTRSCS